jgi:predicted MPP superfamily phosphohydrolase
MSADSVESALARIIAHHGNDVTDSAYNPTSGDYEGTWMRDADHVAAGMLNVQGVLTREKVDALRKAIFEVHDEFGVVAVAVNGDVRYRNQDLENWSSKGWALSEEVV